MGEDLGEGAGEERVVVREGAIGDETEGCEAGGGDMSVGSSGGGGVVLKEDPGELELSYTALLGSVLRRSFSS